MREARIIKAVCDIARGSLWKTTSRSGPQAQAKCRAGGQEDGQEDDQRTEASLLQRRAEGTGLAHPGEGKSSGRPYCGLPVYNSYEQEGA